jgi:hypothetical protein
MGLQERGGRSFPARSPTVRAIRHAANSFYVKRPFNWGKMRFFYKVEY